MSEHARPLSANLLVTGANGYLASQFILDVLATDLDVRVACLIRAETDAHASRRLFDAIETTARNSGVNVPPQARARISMIRGDLDDLNWVADVGVELGEDFEVVHCAASLSFLEADRAQVFETNCGGTQRLLRALVEAGANVPRMGVFNYVSTAYVAGQRTGRILEEPSDPDQAFNNSYEASKSQTEIAVLAICAEQGIRYRIFRPSIIIGHSKTYQTTSMSGFYKVLDRLAKFAETTHGGRAISVGVPREATLDLIPVDIVTAEMIHIIRVGPSSSGMAFHVTNEHATTLFDFALVVCPLVGVSLLPIEGQSGEADIRYRVLDLMLSNYASYLTSEKCFDRSNVRAVGADQIQMRYRLDLSRLSRFVAVYLEQRRHGAAALQPSFVHGVHTAAILEPMEA